MLGLLLTPSDADRGVVTGTMVQTASTDVGVGVDVSVTKTTENASAPQGPRAMVQSVRRVSCHPQCFLSSLEF